MNLSCVFADCCLPDYWGGHSLAHISVPVTNQTTMSQLKSALLSEVAEGAIAGSVAHEVTESEDWSDAAKLAIDRMETKTQGYTGAMFPNIPDDEDDADYSVYAYFVFVSEE